MYFDVADIIVPVWWLLAWGGLVGLVFSTVGAAGGILASVGMISVFGIENPNLVKPMAQALTLVTPLIAVPLYMRQCRLIYSLAFLLGAGGIIEALLGSTLSVSLLSTCRCLSRFLRCWYFSSLRNSLGSCCIPVQILPRLPKP